MALLNCPSLATYSQVLNRRILLTQSNVVFIRRNTRLTGVRELFFALFLQIKSFMLLVFSQISKYNTKIV